MPDIAFPYCYVALWNGILSVAPLPDAMYFKDIIQTASWQAVDVPTVTFYGPDRLSPEIPVNDYAGFPGSLLKKDSE